MNPQTAFQSKHYLNHNNKRQEHLGSLNLDLNNKKVLEVGAGIGDHTPFFLARNCDVFVTEARDENITTLKKLHPTLRVQKLDLEHPPANFDEKFDVVYAYGTLYHLSNPQLAIEFFDKVCSGTLLLETCVSFGDHMAINSCTESVGDPTQSYSGYGCRPTRPWIFNTLKSKFAHVYMPTTQPNHFEFPTDWTRPYNSATGLVRAVFVASRTPIDNSLLVSEIPSIQSSIT